MVFSTMMFFDALAYLAMACRAILALPFIVGFVNAFALLQRLWPMPSCTRYVNRYFGKSMLWITDTRVETSYVAGANADIIEAHIQDSGGIYVANHYGSLDPCILTATAPSIGIYTWFKHELFRDCPWIAYAAQKMGHIPVRRGDATDRQALNDASQALLAQVDVYGKQALGIFPEGKRHEPSNEEPLGSFRLGAFHVACATNACVVPVWIFHSEQLCKTGQIVPTPGVSVRIVYGMPMYPDELPSVFAKRVRQYMLRMRCS